MDRLNVDIIARIVECLRPESHFRWWHASVFRGYFLPYATISREWWDAVERRIFSRIELEELEIEGFASIYATPRRRALLRQMHLLIGLSTYSDKPDDHAQNTAEFAGAMHKLFTAMHTWGPASSVHPAGLHLTVHAVPCTMMLWPSRQVYKYLTLGPYEALPEVQCITDLGGIEASQPRLHAAAACRVLAALPNLRSLTLSLAQPNGRMYAMRRQQRRALADGLRSLRLPCLQRLRLALGDVEPKNHSFVPEDMEEADDDDDDDDDDAGGITIDPLSDALRVFTQSCPLLEELVLSQGRFSPALFRDPRPGAAFAATTTGTWPALRSLTLLPESRVAPSGAWYFTGGGHGQGVEQAAAFQQVRYSDGAVDDDDEEEILHCRVRNNRGEEVEFEVLVGNAPDHAWRTQPDPGVFDPLVQSLMEAAVDGMPRLRSMTFEMANRQPPFVGVRIDCLAAGVVEARNPPFARDWEEERAASVRRCQVWLGRDTHWVVPQRVAALCKGWVGNEGTVAMHKWAD